MSASILSLASASPRRKELLERAGFSVRVVGAQVDETPLPGELPIDYTKRLARSKVLSAVRRIEATHQFSAEEEAPTRAYFQPTRAEEPTRWVLGADTTVAIDDVFLGKPTDAHEAREMLLRLSGREHFVYTGFSLFDLKREKEGLQAVATQVRMKPLGRPEIDKYLSLGESMDKAGSYAIQGAGAYMIQEIRGSYTNVVGLPLCQVIEMMQEMGASDVLPF